MSLLFNVESEEELGFRLGMMWAQAKEAEDMQEPGGLSPPHVSLGKKGLCGLCNGDGKSYASWVVSSE